MSIFYFQLFLFFRPGARRICLMAKGLMGLIGPKGGWGNIFIESPAVSETRLL
jgi:hypothetical protein